LKNKERRFSELKHKVMSSKKPKVLIQLNNAEEVAYLKSIGVNTKPAIYKVYPPYRPGYIPRKSDPWIVRDVLCSRKHVLYLELRSGEAKLLEKYGVKVEEFKYWAFKPERPPVERKQRKKRR